MPLMLLIMTCVEKNMTFEAVFVENVENSHEIVLLMSCKMSLNCTEMAYTNDINNKISLPAIPSFAKNGSIFTKYKI